METTRHRRRQDRRTARLVAIALCLCALPASAQAPEEIWNEVEIADGILGFVTSDGLNPSSFANVVVFHGTSATLVVDSQDRPSAAERVVEALERRGLPPVRWVVNTHWHGDHVVGNSTFSAAWPNAQFVAHPSTGDSIRVAGPRQLAEQVTRNRDIADRISAALEAGEVPEDQVELYREARRDRLTLAEELESATILAPTRIVAESATFDLGGREVRLIHPGPAHTPGDLVVWDRDRRFLAAGDLIEEAPLWLDGADVEGWAAALQQLAALEPLRVLASHSRLHPDAALLEAHRRVLERAVRVAAMQGFGSDASIVAEFEDLEGLLQPWGVDEEDFRAYVIDAVKRIRERSPEVL